MVSFGKLSTLQYCRRFFNYCVSRQKPILQTITCLHQNIVLKRMSFWTKVNNILKAENKSLRSLNHDTVLPGNVSPPREVPSHILLPPYAQSGYVEPAPLQIELKNEQEQENMRKSCKLARMVLDETEKQIGVGITTDELDRFVHELCIKNDCYPSPLNYRGFPKSVCTSVNNVAVHGIPDDRPLKSGDIISIDISIYYNGYHGDCAGTFAVGSVDLRAIELMKAAQECLLTSIAICGPGQPFNAIGKIVSKTAKEHEFQVVPAFCGHGIGTYFHGPPDIMHYENTYPGYMKAGMVFTIEPVLTEGEPDIVILEDGWTAVTVDNRRTAQFEHTILITSTGTEVLTDGQCHNPTTVSQ